MGRLKQDTMVMGIRFSPETRDRVLLAAIRQTEQVGSHVSASEVIRRLVDHALPDYEAAIDGGLPPEVAFSEIPSKALFAATSHILHLGLQQLEAEQTTTT